MTFRSLVLIATLGSAALLGGAFLFQVWGGLAPCPMCLWQRWPHAAAIVIGVATLALGFRPLAWLGALAALATAGIGVFHVGVEQDWWEGPTTCTAAAPGSVSADELFDRIMTAPLVRCDEIAWQMFGLSMPGWNALISFVLVGFWIAAACRKA